MPKKERATRSRKKQSEQKASTDWARIDATTDDDIERDVADDSDAAPIFTEEMFASAQWVEPQIKSPISFRVDPDVLAFFKRQGPRSQTRMNAVLRAFMEGSRPTRK